MTLKNKEKTITRKGNSYGVGSFPNWDNTRRLRLGMILEYEDILKYGQKFYELNSEWRAYNWDKLVALSTLDKEGYISEDIYGLCRRTIKKCDEEMKRIKREMEVILEGRR